MESEAVVGNVVASVPSDAETAALMTDLAEAFREVNAEQGEEFGWGTREASKLDAVCDRFLATAPSSGLRHAMVMALGAYLGELMVRHGEGRWIAGAGEYGAMVLLANGVFCHPHEQVAMRLELGPQLDLGFYFHFAIAGHLGQDTLAG
ncbi:MAG: hypothetical protein ACT4QG_03785 [Sporichthyaceae bacterium]